MPTNPIEAPKERRWRWYKAPSNGPLWLAIVGIILFILIVLANAFPPPR